MREAATPTQAKRLRVGVIGGGNMGWCLAMGLSRAGLASVVVVCDRHPEKAARLVADTGVRALAHDSDVAAESDVVLVSVRGAQLEETLTRTVPALPERSSLVCLSAGISSEWAKQFGKPRGIPIFRAITGVNAAVRQAVTLVLAADASDTEFDPAQTVLSALGEVLPVPTEAELNRWSVLTGCGPALTCLLLEGLAAFGVEAGLSPPEALRLASATIGGTTVGIDALHQGAVEYRSRVAAPGGVVERELNAAVSDRIRREFVGVLQRIANEVTA